MSQPSQQPIPGKAGTAPAPMSLAAPTPSPLSGGAAATVPPSYGNPASATNPLNTNASAAVPPAAPSPGATVSAATPLAPPPTTSAAPATATAAAVTPPSNKQGKYLKWGVIGVVGAAAVVAVMTFFSKPDKAKQGDPGPQKPTPGLNPSSEPPADIKKFSEPLLDFFKSEVEALKGNRPLAPNKPFAPFEDPGRWFGNAADVNERVISAILSKNKELQDRSKGNPALLTEVEIQSIGLPPLNAAHQLAYGYRAPGTISRERLTKQVAPFKGQPSTSKERFLKHPNHIDDWPSDWPDKVVDSIVLRLGQLQRLETALSEVANKPKK